MIRRNMNSRSKVNSKPKMNAKPEMNLESKTNSKPKMFLLKPQGKDYLWGGNRLNDDFSKGIDMEPLAETWECSTHPDGPSAVASGIHKGELLVDVLREHPEYLGMSKTIAGELPILIKLIDAKKDLSIQVHPDDAFANEHEHGSLGKTEMWYVLDAKKDSQLVYGFRRDMEKEQVRASIENGKIEQYVRKVPIQTDDVFYIEAGTIHAVGEGALIAEIQENSNLTYRLYDYNRVDKNGQLRELHIDKALEVADLSGSQEPTQPMRVLKYKPGSALELLCRCKYFQVERLLVNTERCRELTEAVVDSHGIQIFLCISGCGVFIDEEGDIMNFFKGDCFFVPAHSVRTRIQGKASLLKITC